MAETVQKPKKVVNARIQNKYAPPANWQKAHEKNFVPLYGEIILHDNNVYSGEGENINITPVEPTLYVGDGKTPVGNLVPINTYTNDAPMIQDIGGIKASEHAEGFSNVPLNDLITELLYPYTQPVIDSFGMSPSVGVNEMNVQVKVETATVKITKKSKPIKKVELYKGNTVVETKNQPEDNDNWITSSGTTLTFTLNETLSGSTDISYKVKVTDDGGETVESNAQTYNFVYPYFYGVVSDGAQIDSSTILEFTKDIRAKGAHTHTYNTNNACPVIAYPKEYGVLKSIVDPNNFTQTWTKSGVTVDNDDTINGIDYYVYVGGASTATGIKYKFNYS